MKVALLGITAIFSLIISILFGMKQLSLNRKIERVSVWEKL